MNALLFIYEGKSIQFLVNPEQENVMVNATEMGKIFGKEPKDFLRLESTKKFINYQLEKNYIVADVPRYIENHIYFSNNKAGTFMTRKLALKFAAWLDVKFEDWVFSTIDEILFGHYKQHWEAHVRQEAAKKRMDTLREKLLTRGSTELAQAYFEAERNMNAAKYEKTRALRNQLNLFNQNTEEND